MMTRHDLDSHELAEALASFGRSPEGVDVGRLGCDLTWARLQACMVHPEDETRRERLEAWFLAKFCQAAGVDFPSASLPRLVEAADVGVGQDLGNATAGGCMAGDVLLVLLELMSAKVPDAGIDKACFLVSTIYHTEKGEAPVLKDGRGKPFKAGRDTVSNNWRKYRAVSHLWAAYLILLREAEERGIRNNLAEWLDGCKLADLAHSLQVAASQFTLPRNGGPILSDSALKIAGADLVPLKPPELSEEIRKALEEFTPRIRD